MVGAEGRPQHLVAVYRRASLRTALDGSSTTVHGAAMHRLVDGLRLRGRPRRRGRDRGRRHLGGRRTSGTSPRTSTDGPLGGPLTSRGSPGHHSRGQRNADIGDRFPRGVTKVTWRLFPPWPERRIRARVNEDVGPTCLVTYRSVAAVVLTSAWTAQDGRDPTAKTPMKTMRTHAGTRVTASVAGVVVAGATSSPAPLAPPRPTRTRSLVRHVRDHGQQLVTNTHRHGWDFGVDTRSGGHYAFAENGLEIWTDSNTSNDKVTGYRTVDFALSAVGAASIDYTNNTPETFAYGPGAQPPWTSTRTARLTASSSARPSTTATGGHPPRSVTRSSAGDLARTSAAAAAPTTARSSSGSRPR